MKKQNLYRNLKEKHQKEVSNFPMKFAFSQQQLIKGLKELGLNENDTDKVTGIDGGGFIRNEDVKDFNNMFDRHYKELQDEIKKDITGENFIKDMFSYELSNREYGYTEDIEPVLEALGLTIEDINSNENLKNGLALAIKPYHEENNYEDENEAEEI